MKKSMKVLGLALALAPLSMLTACGGQLDSKPNVDINSAGSYSATTAEDFNNAVYDETTHVVKSNLVSYKMGVSIEGRDDNGEGGAIKFVGIFKATEEKQEYAYSSYVNVDEIEATIKYYVPGDGFGYADTNIKGKTEGLDASLNGKYKINEKVSNGIFDDISAADTASDYTYANILSMLDDFQTEDVTIEKAEKGTKVNFKITVVDTKYSSEQIFYFLYDNGKCVGCQYEASATNLSIKVTVEAFDGEIEYPDFSSYKDFLPSLS